MARRLTKENIEWAAHLWRAVRGRALVRNSGYLILAAVALYSNVLQVVASAIFHQLGIALQFPETPAAIPVFFILVAAFLLIFDRLVPETTTLPVAYPHDEKLMREVRDILDAPQLDRFLREHAFGNGSFLFSVLDPLYEVRGMAGSRYSFIDKAVNAAWHRVIDANVRFLNEIASKTYPRQEDQRLQTPYREDENADFHSDPAITARLKVLDDAATDLVSALDAFDAVARRNIPHVI